MSENPIYSSTISPEQKVHEEDAENLQYYLGTVFRPGEIDGLTDSVRRAAVETILLLNSGDPITDLGSHDTRDISIKKIQDEKAGMPKSKAELTAILKGPHKKLSRVADMKTGNAMGAAKSTYLTMAGYRQDSLLDIKKMNQVMNSAPSGEDSVDLGLLRTNREALYVLADHLMERDFLDKMKWPAKNTEEYRNDRKYWRGCLLEASIYAGPSVLGVLTKEACNNKARRLAYWTKHMHRVESSTAGIAVRGALMRGQGFVETPPEPITSPAKSAVEPGIADQATNFDIPTKVHEELMTNYSLQTQRIDTQVRQGVPPEVADLRQFGAPAIYDSAGNVIGFTLPDVQPSAEALVKYELSRKERIKRRLAKRR